MFTFKISPDGQAPFEVKGASRDIARWERTTKGASLHRLQEEMHVVDLYKIAFFACQRAGMWSGTMAEFEDQVDIDTLDDEESQDPTLPAAPSGETSH